MIEEVDYTDKMFDQFMKIFEEYHDKFIAKNAEGRADLVMEHFNLGLFTERQKEFFKVHLITIMESDDKESMIDRNAKASSSITKILKELPPEVAIMCITQLHVDMVLSMKGVLSIIDKQVMEKLNRDFSPGSKS